MRSTMTWLLPATGLAVLIAVSAGVAGGLGGLLEAGQTSYVEIVDQTNLGVVAGEVTVQEDRPLGLSIGADREVPDGGWVVLHAKGDRLLGSGPLETTDETPFEDPNGGTWLSREVSNGEATGWVVPVGSPHYDATLDDTYNFAVVVDWDEVPEDAALVASYHEDLPLDTVNGQGPQP